MRTTGFSARGGLAVIAGAALLLAALAGCRGEQVPAPPATLRGAGPAGYVRRSSSAIAMSPSGALLLVVNPDSSTLTLVDPGRLEVLAELAVGRDPRTVAVDDAGRRAVTANRAAGTLSLIDLEQRKVVGEVAVGLLPWGVVVSPDGARAYVACEGSRALAVVDLAERAVVASIPVPDRPAGLALQRDGRVLYITHLLSGQVSVFDTQALQVARTLPTWVDANLAQSIILDPTGERAFLPMTRSNSANTALTFDTTVFPVVAVVDLVAGAMDPRAIVSLPEADRPVGIPFDAAFTPDGARLYMVNAASDDVSVLAMDARRAVAHIPVGHNPRGVALSPDGRFAYVNNTLSGTVSVIRTGTNRVEATLKVTDLPLPPVLLEGKRTFYSSRSPRLSRDAWISCNTCHWEGEQDGRTWSFRFSGPRNTTSLLGMVNTYPLRWSAEWDESADSEFAILEEQFGAGFLGDGLHPLLGAPNAGRSRGLDSLAAFLDSLALLPNPEAGGQDLAQVEAGLRLFFDREIGCGACHPPPHYTDQRVHDVGTARGEAEVLGPEIDTPTLRGLSRTAPYLHDGRAATLMDVLTVANPRGEHGFTSGLSDWERQALVAFMLALP